MNYFELDTAGDVADGSLCFIAQAPEGMEQGRSRMAVGRWAADVFPDNAAIRLRDCDPGIRLPGYIGNTRAYLIFSSRGRHVIEAHMAGREVEYLGFSLINHKNRVHSTDYCIINPIGGFDALNQPASKISYSPDDGRILNISNIVLDTRKLNDAPHMFRLRQDPVVYIFSEVLIDALSAAAVSNLVVRQLPQQP